MVAWTCENVKSASTEELIMTRTDMYTELLSLLKDKVTELKQTGESPRTTNIDKSYIQLLSLIARVQFEILDRNPLHNFLPENPSNKDIRINISINKLGVKFDLLDGLL